jgi:hypothetical protein
MQDGDGFVMKELKIDNLPVVEYGEKVLNEIALGLEELIMHALQGQCKGSRMIEEIPLTARDQKKAPAF